MSHELSAKLMVPSHFAVCEEHLALSYIALTAATPKQWISPMPFHIVFKNNNKCESCKKKRNGGKGGGSNRQ